MEISIALFASVDPVGMLSVIRLLMTVSHVLLTLFLIVCHDSVEGRKVES